MVSCLLSRRGKAFPGRDPRNRTSAGDSFAVAQRTPQPPGQLPPHLHHPRSHWLRPHSSVRPTQDCCPWWRQSSESLQPEESALKFGHEVFNKPPFPPWAAALPPSVKTTGTPLCCSKNSWKDKMNFFKQRWQNERITSFSSTPHLILPLNKETLTGWRKWKAFSSLLSIFLLTFSKKMKTTACDALNPADVALVTAHLHSGLHQPLSLYCISQNCVIPLAVAWVLKYFISLKLPFFSAYPENDLLYSKYLDFSS